MKNQKRVELDFSILWTGYHQLLAVIYGIEEVYYKISSGDDFISIIEAGLLPVSLGEKHIDAICAMVNDDLREREAYVVRQRFLLGHDRQSRQEIAATLKVTSGRVRQIEQQAIAKLRRLVRNRQLTDIPLRWADVGKRMVKAEKQCEELRREMARTIQSHNEAFLLYQRAAEVLHPLFEEKERRRVEAMLDTPITDLELSVRTANCLEFANITTIRNLVTKTEAEVLRYRNFGRKSLNELKILLEGMGLSFGMTFEE